MNRGLNSNVSLLIFIGVAFLLANPFSDLVDPDCLNLRVS